MYYFLTYFFFGYVSRLENDFSSLFFITHQIILMCFTSKYLTILYVYNIVLYIYILFYFILFLLNNNR